MSRCILDEREHLNRSDKEGMLRRLANRFSAAERAISTIFG